jgi:uncharacterized membrane protein YeaQ/YmgE (transglycosylase-associated protein family)
MSILWTIIIGFVAGVIAKLLHPGPNEPSGFVLTTILGIVGALVATYLGQAIGWYNAWSARSLEPSSCWLSGVFSRRAVALEMLDKTKRLVLAAFRKALAAEASSRIRPDN